MISRIILDSLNNSLLISIIVVLLLLFNKIIKKHLSAMSLYYCCIILLIGFLIPIRPFANWSLFKITTPRVITESERSYEDNCNDIGNNKVTSYDEFTNLNRDTKSLVDAKPTNNGDVDKKKSIFSLSFDSLHILLRLINVHKITILLIIWCIGFQLTFVYHTLHHIQKKKMLLRLSIMNEDTSLQMMLQTKKEELHIHCNVQLRISSIVGSPLTLGGFHKTILLPSCDYDQKELDLLLQHELIHIKRHDIFLSWCLLLCLSIHWYNPIVYCFVAAWKEICEYSCDSLVLQKANVHTRMQYGKLLLKTANNQNQISQLLIMTFFKGENLYGGKNRMKKRLESILDMKKKKTGIISLCLLAVLICTTTIHLQIKQNQM